MRMDMVVKTIVMIRIVLHWEIASTSGVAFLTHPIMDGVNVNTQSEVCEK